MGSCCCLPLAHGRHERESLVINAQRKSSNRGSRRNNTSDRIAINIGDLDNRGSNNSNTTNIEETWKAGIFDCWRQKASNLAIHTDLPRLVRKFRILDPEGHDVTPSHDIEPMVPMKQDQKVPGNLGEDLRMRNDEVIVLNFLLALSKALNDEKSYEYISSKWWNFFPRQEMSGPLRHLLIDMEKTFPDETPITFRVLKMANQRVMFPAFWCLKSKLKVDTLRDKRGTWHITFQIEADRVLIIHTKHQLIDNHHDAMKEEGEFELALIVELEGAHLDLKSVHMEIRNVVLSADLSNDQRQAWQNLFDANHLID